MIHIHIHECGLDVPIDISTLYERYAVYKHQWRPYPHEYIVENRIEERDVDDADYIIEHKRQAHGYEPSAATLVLSGVIVVDMLPEYAYLITQEPHNAKALYDKDYVKHIAGKDRRRCLKKGIINTWREVKTMDGYIHQDMCEPDTHHRHYKSNDGSDGQMLAMQQINTGGQVKANGEIKK